jgi:hypothetical protein
MKGCLVKIAIEGRRTLFLNPTVDPVTYRSIRYNLYFAEDTEFKLCEGLHQLVCGPGFLFNIFKIPDVKAFKEILYLNYH